MKISIITACRNSAATLQDTIDSVLRQTHTDVEHVIKDGGSTDGTVELIRANEARYEGRLKWKSEQDGGIYEAMNEGIRMAAGDVIGILNSDDFFTSDDVLERVAREFAEDPELEAVYGDIHFVKEPDMKRCTRYFSGRLFRPWLMRFGFMPPHPSLYCRREVYERYGLYDLDMRTSSDFEMVVRLFGPCRIRARYMNMDFVTMRAGGESTAGVTSKKKVNRDIAASLRKHGIYSNQLFQMVRYVWRVAELAYTRVKCRG